MSKFSSQEQAVLNPIYEFSRANRCKLYLVGGALRDLLLRRMRPNPDFDFCLKSGALRFGRKLSRKLKCAFVLLDEEHAACRLVKQINGRIYTFDFADFRDTTLEKDLGRRDFTINALALPLEEALGNKDLEASLIDPCGGQADLKKGLVRMAGPNSFGEDPLRILRAFSFGCALNFELTRDTLAKARQERNRISGVSDERIRDELFKILDTPSAYATFAILDKIKVLEIIFPQIKPMRGIGQGPYHHLDVWQHTLETLRQFELILKSPLRDKRVQVYLDEVLAGARKRSSLLKLACLLHDVGKPAALRREKKKIIFHGHERIGLGMARGIWRRLKLSNDEGRRLERIVLWHLRPGYLADNPHPSARAVFRYFRDTGSDALGVLLLSLADQRATKGPLTTAVSRLRHEKIVRKLMRQLLKKQNEKKPARLLTGHDLMRKFKIPASPLVGELLEGLEEAQAIGKIKNKNEAVRLAAKLLKSRK